MNPFSSAAPFSRDPPNQNDVITNPSPFKLLKTQPNPASATHTQSPAVFSTTSSANKPTIIVQQIPANYPALNPPSSSTNNTENKSLSDVKIKTDLILCSKRVQDVFESWKENVKMTIELFQSYSKEVNSAENDVRIIKEKTFFTQSVFMQVKKLNREVEEAFELIEIDMQQLDSTLGFIDKSLDRVFQSSGIYSLGMEEDSIYSSMMALNKSIDEIDDQLGIVLKDNDEKLNSDEHEDLMNLMIFFYEALSWAENRNSTIMRLFEEISFKYRSLM